MTIQDAHTHFFSRVFFQTLANLSPKDGEADELLQQLTESTGMAAEEVERLITFPIETAVNGTAGLRRVRSASAPGISVVWAEFNWDTSTSLARQRIIERLQSIEGALPPEAGAPLLAPASSVMGEIAFVAMSSKKLSAMEVRRVADVEVPIGFRGEAGNHPAFEFTRPVVVGDYAAHKVN